MHFARVCSNEVQAIKNTGQNVNMDRQKNRKYVSPAREKQAARTRQRIIDAAEVLFREKGFAGMTIAEAASRAGVSSQTVYAVFSSKAGIVSAIIEDRVLRDDRNVDAIKLLQTSTDPVLNLKSMAKVIRNIYEGNGQACAALLGAGMVSPQLAELEKELSEIRYGKQEFLVDNLIASGKLLPHLDRETVRDILWALTGRELYYLLVSRRGWSPDRYEEQIATLLITSLVHPDVIAPHYGAI